MTITGIISATLITIIINLRPVRDLRVSVKIYPENLSLRGAEDGSDGRYQTEVSEPENNYQVSWRSDWRQIARAWIMLHIAEVKLACAWR